MAVMDLDCSCSGSSDDCDDVLYALDDVVVAMPRVALDEYLDNIDINDLLAQ